MNTHISFVVDYELNENFQLALLASGENEKEVLERAIRSYCIDQFQKMQVRVQPSTPFSDSQFLEIKRLKAEKHQSWVNLRKAINKRRGLPYEFGTPNVEASAEAFLNKILSTTGMSIQAICKLLDENGYGY